MSLSLEEQRKINILTETKLKEQTEMNAKFETEKRNLNSRLEEITQLYNQEKSENLALKQERDDLQTAMKYE